MSTKIEASAARPYGHVPGHDWLDADLEAESTTTGHWATLTISSGHSQGYPCDQEYRSVEYTARGSDLADAIERVRDEALEYEGDDDELAGYIHTACSRALRQLRGEEEAA